jgi:hypothetical protein
MRTSTLPPNLDQRICFGARSIHGNSPIFNGNGEILFSNVLRLFYTTSTIKERGHAGHLPSNYRITVDISVSCCISLDTNTLQSIHVDDEQYV